MKNSGDIKKSYQQEDGEEKLVELIKEAGETARARKKKAMEVHFQKLRDAVAGNNPSPSCKTV